MQPSQPSYEFLQTHKLNVKTIFAQKKPIILVDGNVPTTIYFPQFHSSITLFCSKHFQILLASFKSSSISLSFTKLEKDSQPTQELLIQFFSQISTFLNCLIVNDISLN
jgi:hypothetical protein